MKSGQFVCLGSLQRLKNRFSRGYTVQVKVHTSTMQNFKDQLHLQLPGVHIEGEMEQEIYTVSLSFLNKNDLEQHNGMLYCTVPIGLTTEQPGHDLVRAFEFFNDKMEQHEIESYTLSQTTLEQIFVRLVDGDQESCSITA